MYSPQCHHQPDQTKGTAAAPTDPFCGMKVKEDSRQATGITMHRRSPGLCWRSDGQIWGMLRTRTLSVATVRNIRQNRVFAFMYNGLSIPIAASLLYPFSGQLLSPKIAALPMSLSSASVVFNDLRLRQARVG